MAAVQSDAGAVLLLKVSAGLPQKSASESPGNVLICEKGAGGSLAVWQS